MALQVVGPAEHLTASKGPDVLVPHPRRHRKDPIFWSLTLEKIQKIKFHQIDFWGLIWIAFFMENSIFQTKNQYNNKQIPKILHAVPSENTSWFGFGQLIYKNLSGKKLLYCAKK